MGKSMEKKSGLSRARYKEAKTAYLCLIPAICGLVFITYIPLVATFILSFFKWTGLTEPEFIGFDNFKRLFTDDFYFTDSIKATVSYALITVVGSLTYSLFIAILLNRKIPARAFWRAVFYIPYIIPTIAVCIGWSWMYEKNFGIFNYILSMMGIQKVNWLNLDKTVLWSLALMAVWCSGNLIVIFLAGLQNVPRVYLEAAQVDGANGLKRFIHITLPNMTPIIFYNLLMSLVTNMQIMVPAMVLTSGGPGNKTMFMSYLMYRYAFIKNQIGYASAVSFVFFVMIAIFTAILFATSKTWLFYEGGEN